MLSSVKEYHPPFFPSLCQMVFCWMVFFHAALIVLSAGLFVFHVPLILLVISHVFRACTLCDLVILVILVIHVISFVQILGYHLLPFGFLVQSLFSDCLSNPHTHTINCWGIYRWCSSAASQLGGQKQELSTGGL